MSYSFHNFPADLFPNLLSWLPAKSLLRFKCVSKLWLSIVEDPKFTSIHAKRASSITQVSLISNSDGGGRRVSNLCGINWSGGLDGVMEALCPVPDDKYGRLVGSSNGVLCILCLISCISYHRVIILWNPLSRKYHVLPPPPLSVYHHVYTYTYGFGYDKASEDYKVVWFETRCPRPRAAVYSKRMNTWRTIHDGFPTPARGGVGVLFGGALHWISEDNSSLIVFNLANEEFDSFAVPFKVDARLLIMRDGRLCMMTYDKYGCFDVLIMLNYGEWIEFRFETKTDFDVCRQYLIPIAYVKTPKPVMMMFRMIQGKNLVFYDAEEQRLVFNSQVGDIDGMHGGEVFPYVQTLELYN